MGLLWSPSCTGTPTVPMSNGLQRRPIVITTVLAYPGVPDGTLSGTRWSPDGVPMGGRWSEEYENRGEKPSAHRQRTLGCAQRTLPGMIIVVTPCFRTPACGQHTKTRGNTGFSHGERTLTHSHGTFSGGCPPSASINVRQADGGYDISPSPLPPEQRTRLTARPNTSLGAAAPRPGA